MLIIFDLDDTLIDTTGCITPIKLEDALHRMVQEGLVLENLPHALEMLRRLDEAAISSRQSLSEFLELMDADPRFLTIAIDEMHGNISSEIPVFPLDGAHEALAEIGRHHQLALVTMGRSDQQLAKMKNAGIDSTIFSKIVVADEKGKKTHYQAIMEELGYAPKDVVVCGDRILTDLTPAKELGFKTVQMRHGRGLNSTSPKSDVDYAISKITEMKSIIADIMNFTSY